MAMKKGTRKILDFLKKAPKDADYTAQDIADALGMNVKSVNASVTSAFTRKEPPLAERIEAQVQMEDGKWKDVKIIKLTEEGYEYDPDNEIK